MMAAIETGWLIERADSPPSAPLYWCGIRPPLDDRDCAWTADHGEAIRFARQIDARRASTRLLLGPTRICEHAWGPA